jgi:hypothetical protein
VALVDEATGAQIDRARNALAQYLEAWTADIVYRRLGPGIRQRLHEIVPRDDKGRLKFSLHQALTRDVGVIALGKHLSSVTSLAIAAESVGSDSKTRWSWYLEQLDRIHPPFDDQLLLNFMPADTSVGNEDDEDEASPS